MRVEKKNFVRTFCLLFHIISIFYIPTRIYYVYRSESYSFVSETRGWRSWGRMGGVEERRGGRGDKGRWWRERRGGGGSLTRWGGRPVRFIQPSRKNFLRHGFWAIGSDTITPPPSDAKEKHIYRRRWRGRFTSFPSPAFKLLRNELSSSHNYLSVFIVLVLDSERSEQRVCFTVNFIVYRYAVLLLKLQTIYPSSSTGTMCAFLWFYLLVNNFSPGNRAPILVVWAVEEKNKKDSPAYYYMLLRCTSVYKWELYREKKKEKRFALSRIMCASEIADSSFDFRFFFFFLEINNLLTHAGRPRRTAGLL